MNDYSQTLFHFVGVRRHFFKDVRYNIYVFKDHLVMGQKANDTKPKYRIDFSMNIQIQFVLDKTYKKGLKLNAFAFKYMDKYKEMFSDHDQLMKFKELISNRVTFYKIADFYDPQYIIGKGSSARVLLVQKLYDSTKYAVKSIDKTYLFKSENGMEAFQSEVRILSLLSTVCSDKQTYFIKLYEIFEGDLTYYLVVELMQGKTLQDELDQLKQRRDRSILRPEYTKTIMRKLFEGVKLMHDNNIIHRDLKPDNIMFAVNGDYSSLRIVDFGLATETTVDKYMFPKCGTPGYVAPEVLNLQNRLEKYNPICDLFSCGCIFYKLLTGRSLFPGTQFNEVLKLNKSCEIDLREIQETISPDAFNLLSQLLERDPSKRITAVEAVKHPYLQDISPFTSNQQLSANILTGQPLEQKLGQDIDFSEATEEFSPFQNKVIKKQKEKDVQQNTIKLHKVVEHLKEDESMKEENISDEVMPEFVAQDTLQIQQLPYFKRPGLQGSRKMVDKKTHSNLQSQRGEGEMKIDLDDREELDRFEVFIQNNKKNYSPKNSMNFQNRHSSIKQTTVGSFYNKEPLSGIKKHRQSLKTGQQNSNESQKESNMQSQFLSKMKTKTEQPLSQSQFMEQLNLFNRNDESKYQQ